MRQNLPAEIFRFSQQTEMVPNRINNIIVDNSLKKNNLAFVLGTSDGWKKKKEKKENADQEEEKKKKKEEGRRRSGRR